MATTLDTSVKSRLTETIATALTPTNGGKLMRIRFLTRVVHKQNRLGQVSSHAGDPPLEIIFEEGKEYEIDDTLGAASRWIRRAKAVEVPLTKAK